MSSQADRTPVPAARPSGFHRGVSARRDRDPIYRDPMHTQTPKAAPLAMGSMDMTFLLQRKTTQRKYAPAPHMPNG